jgi:mannose-6-phosphate isomerase
MACPALQSFELAADMPAAQTALRAWMLEHALPFWAGWGHDGPGRGFHEYLSLDGAAGGAPYKRMRVQARQIYVFSHAALLGWQDGERLARDAYGFITRCGEHASGGWIRRLTPAGDGVLDPAIDLYDQAFVLFALAWYARLTQDDEPLARARRTIEWIRTHMSLAPAGFRGVLPTEPGPRQQNPHMHLLEAAIALYETSREPTFLYLAREMVELFRSRLFDQPSGALGEYFDADWTIARGDAGSYLEPGHHYEWVWLLDRFEHLAGEANAQAIDALYRTALFRGTDPETGLVWDAISRNGGIARWSVRLWPQTEALRAHVVMMRRGADSAKLIAKTMRNLGRRFFAGCPLGAWIDRFDGSGAPDVETIPASSLYHVFSAFAELDAAASPTFAQGDRPASSAGPDGPSLPTPSRSLLQQRSSRAPVKV